MNNSTSKIFAGSPTRWPSNSFPAGRTTLTALLAIGLAGIAFVVGSIILVFDEALRVGLNLIVSSIVLQIVIEAVAVIVLFVRLPRLAHLSYRELGFYPPNLGQIGLAILGAIAMVVIVEGGATIIQTLMHQKHEQQVVQLFNQMRSNPPMLWLFAIFATVIAPFLEESMFRLFLFNALRSHWGFWPGAIVSAIVFGAVHADLFVFGPLILGGILLATVYYRTGNAFCSMVTHGLFNTVTVLALIFAPNLTS